MAPSLLVVVRTGVPPVGVTSTCIPAMVGSPSSRTPSLSTSSTGRTVRPVIRVTPSATSTGAEPTVTGAGRAVVARQPVRGVRPADQLPAGTSAKVVDPSVPVVPAGTALLPVRVTVQPATPASPVSRTPSASRSSKTTA